MTLLGGGGAVVGRFYASGLNTNKKSTSVSMANIPCYALLNKYLNFRIVWGLMK